MDDWTTVLLVLGGLALFVLIVFGAALAASALLSRERPTRSDVMRRSRRRRPGPR